MSDFKDYIIETLLGEAGKIGDTIIDQSGETFAYIDAESQQVYLITVELAKFEVAK